MIPPVTGCAPVDELLAAKAREVASLDADVAAEAEWIRAALASGDQARAVLAAETMGRRLSDLLHRRAILLAEIGAIRATVTLMRSA